MTGVLWVAIAVFLACVGVFGYRLPARLQAAGRVREPLVHWLHRLHSGHIGDYVAWLLLGMTMFAAIVFLA